MQKFIIKCMTYDKVRNQELLLYPKNILTDIKSFVIQYFEIN